MTLIVALLTCAAVPQAASTQEAAKIEPPKAYLDTSALPDPRSYLQPPPVPGTAAFAADRFAYESALAGKEGDAWKRAVSQASVSSPAVQQQIQCALGVRLNPASTSSFGKLMRRSALTLGVASEHAKAAWNRDRPYIGEAGAVTCDPGTSSGKQSPGYPSGHAAIGWMWGLMLAELAPERANESLAWGAALGDNRVACRVHYPSDVFAGRAMGAAVLARLHADPAFRADMEAARAEIAAARATAVKPDCTGS